MTKRVSIPVQVLDPSELIGRNLGPLALVNPLLEKMDIRRIVDQHCPPDKRLEVAVGEVIHALVATASAARNHSIKWASGLSIVAPSFFWGSRQWP
jgi:hypothetical protein